MLCHLNIVAALFFRICHGFNRGTQSRGVLFELNVLPALFLPHHATAITVAFEACDVLFELNVMAALFPPHHATALIVAPKSWECYLN